MEIDFYFFYFYSYAFNTATIPYLYFYAVLAVYSLHYHHNYTTYQYIIRLFTVCVEIKKNKTQAYLIDLTGIISVMYAKDYANNIYTIVTARTQVLVLKMLNKI